MRSKWGGVRVTGSSTSQRFFSFIAHTRRLIADDPGRELDKSTPEGQIIAELMGLRVVWLASKDEQWDELEEWMAAEEAKEGKKIIRIDRTDKTPDTS